MKKIFVAACFHPDVMNKCIYNTQTLYGQGIINDVLTFTDHSVRIVTNDLEGFLSYENDPRVEILYPCLDGLTLEYKSHKYASGFGGFNYNLKHLCFYKPFDEKYEVVIYSDCDQKLEGWNEEWANESLEACFLNGYDFLAADTNRSLEYSLSNFESAGDSKNINSDLFANKFIGYQIDSSNLPSSWLSAVFPSENFFVIKNNQKKIQAFYESWSSLNDKLQKSEHFSGAHHDGFEIGISAQEASFKIGEYKHNPLSFQYNGRKYKKNPKVKVCANWTDCKSVTRRLVRQFKVLHDDISDIDFVQDDSYDYIVFFNYVSEAIKPGSKAILFSNEPDWTGQRQKNINEYKDMKFLVVAQNKEVYDLPEKVSEEPVCMFYGGRGENDWTYTNIVENKNYFKSKAISSIVSNVNYFLNGEEPENCLYSKRINLIQSLINNELSGNLIDVYGWQCAEGCKELVNKIDGLRDYRFSLCIENSREDNFVTEKFHDAVLTDTIPIYYGPSNIKDIYPEDGYILLENLEDVESCIRTIKRVHENSESLYKAMISETRKIKQKFLTKNNPLSRIKKFIKEEEQANGS